MTFAVSMRHTMAGARRIAAQRASPPVLALPAPTVTIAPKVIPGGKVLRFPRLAATIPLQVRNALHRDFAERFLPYSPSARLIIARVAAWHGFTFEDLSGQSRKKELIVARSDAIVAMRYAFPFQSLPWLGRQINLDHTTVLHHLRKRGVR